MFKRFLLWLVLMIAALSALRLLEMWVRQIVWVYTTGP